MTDEHSINDPLASQSDDAPAKPTINPEDTAKYWKDKYNGLNGHAIKTKTKLDKVESELETLREQAEGEKLTLSQQAALAKQEAADAKKLADLAVSERDQLKTRAELSKSIREEFPQLSAAFESGLILGIDTMTPEARTEYLTRYAEHFTPAADKPKDKKAGSLPAPVTAVPPRKEGVTTKADAARAMQAAYVAGGPNDPTYLAAFADYKNIVFKEAQ